VIFDDPWQRTPGPSDEEQAILLIPVKIITMLLLATVNGAALSRETDSRITIAVEPEILIEFDFVGHEIVMVESDTGTCCSLHRKLFTEILVDP
jgi:hypothetical protein